MVIFLNMDGSCQKVTPEHIYQGSNNVNDITVIAPYAKSTTLFIGFILPNGLYWQSSDGFRYMPMDYVPQSIDKKVGAWHYKLRDSVTELQGDLYIAINAVTAQGNTTSYLCKAIIEKSVLPSLPPTPEPGVYELILQYLGRVQVSLVSNIEKVPGTNNEIRYTDNYGVISAPIVIGGGEYVPQPENIASKVLLPASAWTAQNGSYTATVMAAQHGQMRDGATANDLWVSFDEAEEAAFKGTYEDYTINEAGDITITVTTPIALTVRVWNGKGLVDTVAREQIAAETSRAEAAETQLQKNIDSETERAETAEQNLQEQINHIEESGYDKTARDMIVAETERAETAESVLSDRITANASDIVGLNSDVAGLREDINNESHFRGMFNTVEELRAAYPTATPNDYAWIAGGNIWTYGESGWTDTGKPVPSTAVPASTSTPLMDGVASVGTENSYARGDHRHPRDNYLYSPSNPPPIDSALSTASANPVQNKVITNALNSKVSKLGDTIDGNLSVNGTIEIHASSYPALTLETGDGEKVLLEKTREDIYFVWRNSDGSNKWILVLPKKEGTIATLDDVHPVDSIFISLKNISPASLFGGEWAKVPKEKVLWIIQSTVPDSMAGGNRYAGLPNITGTLGGCRISANTGADYSYPTYMVNGNALYWGGSPTGVSGGSSGSTYNSGTVPIKFDANVANSIYGQSDTVQPPAFTVFAWYRTA